MAPKTPTDLVPETLNFNNLYSRLVLAALAITLIAMIGCSSNTDEVDGTPYDREDFTAYDGPPLFPIIFEGNYTVDGEPGPADQTIYAEFIHGGSPRSTTYEGSYVQVILGPVSVDDIEHGIISFYLGTRDGDHVKAAETWDWEEVGSPTNQVLDLSFPRLPSS
jgi:hypothetical protein